MAINCKTCYLRVRRIYTSYAVSLKQQNTTTRIVKKEQNLPARVVNDASAYLSSTDLFHLAQICIVQPKMRYL